MNVPKDDFEALVLALRLAITAPDDEKSRQCFEFAESFNLCDTDTKRAVNEVLRQLRESN
jgi:hypothetical protein